MRETTVGVAMIVRNGASSMAAALEPFVGVVDEIGIVLGGLSKDDTAGAAARLATKPVGTFAGEVDEAGRLWDFAAARQQATDLVATDWVMVVDADEVWRGVGEHLRKLVDDLEEAGDFGAAQFPLRLDNGELYQARLFRRAGGKWQGAVHEYWQVLDGRKTAKTGLISGVQKLVPSSARPGHNVAIARRLVERGEATPRVLALLGRDLLRAGEAHKALQAVDQFLLVDDGADINMTLEAHYCRAGAFLKLERAGDALQAALQSLTVRGYGMGWAAVAEAAVIMAEVTKSRELAWLAVSAADRARELGRGRESGWCSADMVTWVPLALRARALLVLGRGRAALAALDLGLLLAPENQDMARMRADLCQQLGVIE